MAAYSYSAINAEGAELAGEVHAPDLDAAREQLRIRGLLASHLKELPASGEEGARTVFKKIKPKTLQIFSRQFATMIEAGLNVVSALVILDEVLDRVAFQIEKATQIKRRVKGAMLYPTMVLIFATLVLIGMLMFLVPVFVKIFGQLGGELPTLTQYVVNASNVLRNQWYIVFPSLFASIWGIRRAKKTEQGRRVWDAMKLRIPMKISDTVRK